MTELTEPPEGSMVLVNNNAVWVHENIYGADVDYIAGPDFHWWQLDGGNWNIDPVRWQDLETKNWVQLIRVDPKKS